MSFFVDRRARCQYCILLSGALFCSIIARLLSQPLYSIAYCFFIAAILFASVSVLREVNSVVSDMPAFLRRMIRWMHAQTLEFFSLSMLGLLSLASLFRKSHPVSSFGKTRPILLVHGYLNARICLGFSKKISFQKWLWSDLYD